MKVGDSRINIFRKRKLYVESPRVMVYKCFGTNCSTVYKTGQKKPSFHFPDHRELQRKWIYFVNRKDWSHTAQSVICIDRFEGKFIKRDKKCKLPWQLLPVPTIHNDSKSNL